MLLSQVTLLDPKSEFHKKAVNISVENGLIKSIVPAEAGDTVTYVSPGWVDVFADYAEPGFEQKETIATGLRAAAAGGFTDVLLAPNTKPAISDRSTVEYITSKASGNAVRLHPLGTISRDLEGKGLAEMLDMHAHGAVAFTDGWQHLSDPALMLKALEYLKAIDGVVISVPMDKGLSAGSLMNEGIVSTRLGVSGSPEIAETLIIHRDIELARYANSKIHFSGISTAASAALIRKAKAEGLKVTCSVTPYHLALTDDALKNYDSNFKVNPPLRTESDRQALIEALADGTIDCIASHHRPQDWDGKNKELEYAGYGMALQELVFPIVWTAVKEKVILERLIDALTSRPREIFNLPARNIVAKSSASFTIFTTEATTRLSKENSHSLAWNNPFLGMELEGKVMGISVNKT